MSFKKQVLCKANPNRHGSCRVIKFTFTDGAPDEFAYFGPGESSDEDDGTSFETDEQAARDHFDSEVKRLAELPNYEAQAAYDAEHGTDNGYAPWQYGREY